MTRLPLVLLLSVTAGCTETIELTHDPLANLASIEIVPSDAMITITDLGAPHHTLQYQAMGRFRDGSTKDVTRSVAWSVDDEQLGAFDEPGLFVASHAAVGSTHVFIGTRELASEASLTVMVDATIVDPTFPPPAANLFGAGSAVVTGDPTRSPDLLYPADATVFPRAVSRTLFQLARGDLNDAVRIQFDNELLHLAVETGGDRWAADGPIQQILSTAGVIAPLRTEIRATASGGDGTVYGGTPLTLSFSRDTPGGAIYFWSASTNGIMRGGVDATSAAKLYPGEATCVGCHAISRDGSQLAMGVDNGTSFDLLTIDVSTLAPTIAASPARLMGWATYSPDGSRLVVANNGVLTEYDARTGATIGGIAVGANKYATHPDWSPDGSSLAIALTGQTPNNLDVKAASIAVVPRTGGTWGTPQVLLTGSNTNNNYFPRWSPDGSVLAFVHATTASQGAISAELMLLPRAGGSPTPLATANYRVGRVDLPDLANTMPAWAPNIGQHAWLSFVSARPYGNVLAGGRGQIWISAIDLTATSAPSHPAFWLPCQDVTVLNNNPSWSGEAITP
jgi:hypothetical protein